MSDLDSSPQHPTFTVPIYAEKSVRWPTLQSFWMPLWRQSPPPSFRALDRRKSKGVTLWLSYRSGAAGQSPTLLHPLRQRRPAEGGCRDGTVDSCSGNTRGHL